MHLPPDDNMKPLTPSSQGSSATILPHGMASSKSYSSFDEPERGRSLSRSSSGSSRSSGVLILPSPSSIDSERYLESQNLRYAYGFPPVAQPPSFYPTYGGKFTQAMPQQPTIIRTPSIVAASPVEARPSAEPAPKATNSEIKGSTTPASSTLQEIQPLVRADSNQAHMPNGNWWGQFRASLTTGDLDDDGLFGPRSPREEIPSLLSTPSRPLSRVTERTESLTPPSATIPPGYLPLPAMVPVMAPVSVPQPPVPIVTYPDGSSLRLGSRRSHSRGRSRSRTPIIIQARSVSRSRSRTPPPIIVQQPPRPVVVHSCSRSRSPTRVHMAPIVIDSGRHSPKPTVATPKRSRTRSRSPIYYEHWPTYRSPRRHAPPPLITSAARRHSRSPRRHIPVIIPATRPIRSRSPVPVVIQPAPSPQIIPARSRSRSPRRPIIMECRSRSRSRSRSPARSYYSVRPPIVMHSPSRSRSRSRSRSPMRSGRRNTCQSPVSRSRSPMRRHCSRSPMRSHRRTPYYSPARRSRSRSRSSRRTRRTHYRSPSYTPAYTRYRARSRSRSYSPPRSRTPTRRPPQIGYRSPIVVADPLLPEPSRPSRRIPSLVPQPPIVPRHVGTANVLQPPPQFVPGAAIPPPPGAYTPAPQTQDQARRPSPAPSTITSASTNTPPVIFTSGVPQERPVQTWEPWGQPSPWGAANNHMPSYVPPPSPYVPPTSWPSYYPSVPVPGAPVAPPGWPAPWNAGCMPGTGPSPYDNLFATPQDLPYMPPPANNYSKDPVAAWADMPAQPVPAHPRHPRFFFTDGNVTIVVEKTLYKLHRYLFNRGSWFLSVNEPTYMWESKKDFDRFLTVLYPSDYSKHECETAEEWTSVLAVADRANMQDIRRLAIAQLATCAGPVDKIVLGHRYGVQDWLAPAYLALAMRPESITAVEGAQLGVDALVRVAALQDEIYGNLKTYINPEKFSEMFASKLAI